MQEFMVRELVSWPEADASGDVVNFMRVLQYFEMGECQALEGLDIKLGHPSSSGVLVPHVHVEISYYYPLLVGQWVDIRTVCQRIGNSSLTWQHEIFREDECCVLGFTTSVLLECQGGKPTRVPTTWRQYLGYPLL